MGNTLATGSLKRMKPTNRWNMFWSTFALRMTIPTRERLFRITSERTSEIRFWNTKKVPTKAGTFNN
jgi:hypothetical protein